MQQRVVIVGRPGRNIFKQKSHRFEHVSHSDTSSCCSSITLVVSYRFGLTVGPSTRARKYCALCPLLCINLEDGDVRKIVLGLPFKRNFVG